MELPSIVLLNVDYDNFADKYKIESSKLNNWDYSNPGKYFITICTYKKNNFFGKIENNKIRLKEIGLVAKSNWLEITRHFDNIKLDEFIVMPNHVHGIIEIIKPLNSHVETRNCASLHNDSNFKKMNNKSNQLIPKIIRIYKGSVQKYANDNKIFFGWQPRYFDEVIFDDKRYFKIKNYIINNPDNWVKDKLFSDNQTDGTAM
jgi:REP element-mobilizing transposase RayT